MAELPLAPWQAQQGCAFCAPAAASWALAPVPAATAQKKKAARRRPLPEVMRSVGQAEDQDAVAALEVELRVAAAAHRHVLLLADLIRDGLGIRAGAAVEAPQLLAGLRIERVEAAVALAEEEQAARGGEAATDERLRGVVFPDHLAGIDIHSGDATPLLLARDCLEGAAQPQLGAARILRRLDVVGHRLVQVERDGEPVLLVPRHRRPLDAAVRARQHACPVGSR